MEFAKLAKKIFGKESETVTIYEGSASFYKRGGHAGSKRLTTIEERAKALGFVKESSSNTCSPDGYHSNNGEHFVHPDGHKLRTNEHYGAVAYENTFSATLTCAKGEE